MRFFILASEGGQTFSLPRQYLLSLKRGFGEIESGDIGNEQNCRHYQKIGRRQRDDIYLRQQINNEQQQDQQGAHLLRRAHVIESR